MFRVAPAYQGMPQRHRNFILNGLLAELESLERARKSIHVQPPQPDKPGWLTREQQLTNLVDRAEVLQEEIELIQGYPFAGR